MAEDVALVIDGELALLSGPVRRLAAQVDQLLDPEFTEIGTSGRLWTRAEVMAALASDHPPGAGGIAATQMAGRAVGADLVLLTYLSHWQGRSARRSSLWRRSAGRWRLLHHQGTPLHNL